jgi:hypothetical protein
MAESLDEANWNVEVAIAIFQAKTDNEADVTDKDFVRLRHAIAKQVMRELIGGKNSEDSNFSEIWSAMGDLRKYVTEKD